MHPEIPIDRRCRLGYSLPSLDAVAESIVETVRDDVYDGDHDGNVDGDVDGDDVYDGDGGGDNGDHGDGDDGAQHESVHYACAGDAGSDDRVPDSSGEVSSPYSQL